MRNRLATTAEALGVIVPPLHDISSVRAFLRQPIPEPEELGIEPCRLAGNALTERVAVVSGTIERAIARLRDRGEAVSLEELFSRVVGPGWKALWGHHYFTMNGACCPKEVLAYCESVLAETPK